MTDSLDSAKSTSQSHTASCMQTSKQQLNPQIHDDASPHHLPRPQCAPPHLEWRPAGAVHVCFSESDEDFSHALIRDLREHGHDVTDCQRSPVPGQPELKQMAALVQSAVWVVGVVSLAALDSIWFTMQLHWALDVAADRGMCQLILVLQPDVNVDLMPPLLEFFPQIWTANEEWKAELQYLLSGRPTPLPDNHRRLVEEQAFLCGAQASLWPSLSTPSLDRASSLQSLDSRPQVPLSVWSRFLQRTRRSLLTSRDQAVASLNSVPEVSDGLQQTSEEEDQFLASEPDSAELQTKGAVHFLHREEDEGHVREVKGWLESEGVPCTDSGLSVRPGEWELNQLQNLVTCAAWVVVIVTLGSLDSMMLDLMCQVASLEAFRRGSANVVVVLAHPRLYDFLPQVLSPFPTLLAAGGEDWRSRLKDLVTSLPQSLSLEEVSGPGLSAVQRLWKAASACSLERQPDPCSSTQAVSSREDSMGSRPILPLWLWPSVASRQRRAQLKTAAEQQSWECRPHCASSEKSATHVTIDMALDDNDGVTLTDEKTKSAAFVTDERKLPASLSCPTSQTFHTIVLNRRGIIFKVLSWIWKINNFLRRWRIIRIAGSQIMRIFMYLYIIYGLFEGLNHMLSFIFSSSDSWHSSALGAMIFIFGALELGLNFTYLFDNSQVVTKSRSILEIVRNSSYLMCLNARPWAIFFDVNMIIISCIIWFCAGVGCFFLDKYSSQNFFIIPLVSAEFDRVFDTETVKCPQKSKQRPSPQLQCLPLDVQRGLLIGTIRLRE